MTPPNPSTTPVVDSANTHPADGVFGTQEELPGFRVALANFNGPFEVLLNLIGKRKLDVTTVALSQVTDDFIAYVKALGTMADLDEITEFILIAATLLDLKTARLLPRGEVDSEEDLALLESRDLLFARLLQYKAYAQVADLMAGWAHKAPRRYPRTVGLEEQFTNLLPPVEIPLSPQEFALMAAGAMRPKPPATVGVDHLHLAHVSVPQQAGIVLEALKNAGTGKWLSFSSITANCSTVLEVVGRFLAVLELFKAGAVDCDHDESLFDVQLSWTGKQVDPSVVASGTWE